MTVETDSETIRPCDGCGRPEHKKRGISGPPRCLSCDLLADEAIMAGYNCDNIDINWPATIGIGSDSYPASVSDVKRDANGDFTAITVRRESTGKEQTFTRRKNGLFVQKGDAHQTYTLTLGVRVDYRSPEF